ncbi:hypothetical protein BDZ94DRAFT_1298515 [Collybia nuda]|uniref:RRM domain-containing protein n=1 Tax=Collybia nuda TaxID=64659 RepID=A0A9P5Y5E7_9AGAR|nr:hypothetical protein BDZ94DRAFT_1298515 [Collybia nuda]
MHPISRYPLKPHFQHSSLFAKGLPEDIGDDEIRRIFRNFHQILRINIISADNSVGGSWRRLIWGEMKGAKVAQVEFSSIAIAEKAFAVLNLRVIPDSNPPVVLALSPSRDQSPYTLTFSGYPRLVNPIPSHFTDIDLYTLIRRFGALASARVDNTLGGIVQFWNEDDACAAEVSVRSAFARTSRVTLQAYDPRTIKCFNLPPSIDELGLRTLFEQFGYVTSIRVAHNSNGGCGLVSFIKPDEAFNAIQALHGTLLESKELVLRYHEPGTHFEDLAQPTSNGEVAQPKHQLTSTGHQGSANEIKKSSKSTTASSPSVEEAEKAKESAELLESERKRTKMQEQETQRKLEEKMRKEREEAELKEHEAAQKAHKEAELKARKDAEQEALKEAEQKAHEEAEQKAREAILQALRDTQQKTREEAEQKAHKEEELRARKDAEQKALKEAEEVHKEAERKAHEATIKMARDAEHRAREEDEQKARKESELKAREAESIAREATERKAREVEQNAQELEQAMQKERGESERKEAERKAQEAKQREHEEAERKEREAKQKEREEAERKEHEEKERAHLKEEARLKKWAEATKAEQERCHMRDNTRWAQIPWTDKYAIQHVLHAGSEFQKLQFSEGLPLVFESVPWPISESRSRLGPDNITSDNVKAFFASAKTSLKAEQYNKLLEVVHDLFLPDAWRERKALESVMDPSLRQSLGKAGNIVSQAVTPTFADALAIDPLKPHFLNSSLFVKNLPGAIKDEEIRRIFEEFEVLRVLTTRVEEPTAGGGGGKRNRKRKGKKGTKTVQIEFASITAAEKAFAILNLRVNIPGSIPPILLTLSPSPDQSSISEFTGNPRIVKSLPSFFVTDTQLYTFLRPFGPLASAHIDHTLGGVVQFWNDDDACAAEAVIRTVFAGSLKITLQAYDPCNIYCANLCPDVDEPTLRAVFEPFGVITSTRLMRGKGGRNICYGFVGFESPSEASNAMYALQGAILGSKSLTLRYHEPKMSSKPTVQPTLKKEETPTRDEPTSNQFQSGWGGSDKSSDDTAVESSNFCETHEEAKQEYEASRHYEEKLERLHTELSDSHNLRSSERETTESLRSQIKQLEEQVSDLRSTLREAELDRDALRVQSEEWRRKFTITDSRLKIVELEGDRPLWEAAKKKREMKEKEEAEKAEQARRKAELLESERKMRELLEQEKRRVLEDKARKEREEAQRKARERAIAEEKERARAKEAIRLKAWKEATQAEQQRCRLRDANLWGTIGEWANQHALQRVAILSTEFGQTKFSEEMPLTFENVPWPVLEDPMTLGVDDITWDSVEAFFVYAKTTQGVDRYKKFIETIHRLFHPDKWRARRALETVMEETLRKSLERAGNIVSQAITPLWRDTKNGP